MRMIPDQRKSGCGIKHGDEMETVEVRVSGIDFLDAMLPHEDGSVHVMQDVTAQAGHLRYDFA